MRRHEVVTPLAYYLTPDQARLLQDGGCAPLGHLRDPFADKEAFDIIFEHIWQSLCGRGECSGPV